VGGACYPSGSPQMLPNKLEKAIERYGGQVVYRQKVEEILIWQEKAYGVRLQDGTEVMADRVVSNATIWNLYGKLVKPRHIKPRRMKWAQGFEPTIGVVMLYMSVREEAIPAGTRPIEMLVENALDLKGSNYVVFIPSLDDPSIAPPGRHSMSAICPARVKWPDLEDRFYQSEGYYKLKEEVADKALDDLERMYFTNLRKHILTLDVGTPTTLERYTLKNFGGLGGPKLTMRQGFFNRLRARSDWKNLYCVGDSTSMGEGVISAAVSGVGAANRVLEDLGFPIYTYRKFARQQVNLIQGRPWTPPPAATEAISEDNAGRAARECQHCESPACRDACPAGIDTCAFARRIEAGNFVGAARVLRDVNPFSEVCGILCPSERFCEKKCNRHEFSDSPVRIRELHGWVCGRVSGFEGWDRYTAPPNGKRIAVIGAGPAGLSAAHYLARMGYGVDILDKAGKPGGVLSHAVPVFRLPEGVVQREIKGLTLPGMNFQYDKALGRDFTLGDLQGAYTAVFLAPGLGKGRALDLPGGRKARQTDALSFLNTCRAKGKVKVEKRVVVIGGGSVAADAARVARKAGAGSVVLVCLEKADEMPCLPAEQEELKALGIGIENGWGPKEFVSESRLSLVGCTSVFDDAGRFKPAFDEQQTMEVALDQVIVAIGQTLEPSLADCLKRDLGADGHLPVDKETLEVQGHPGIYAGGDIIRGAGTVVEAVADGRRAARAMDRAIKRGLHA